MNREDAIRMAKSAGMIVYQGAQDRVLFEGNVIDVLTRFADLAIENFLEQSGQYLTNDATREAAIKEAFAAGAAHEREECAKFANEFMEEHEGVNYGIGTAILARGQA